MTLSPRTSSSKMSSHTQTDLFRKLDRTLVTRYAREHIMAELRKRRAATLPQIFRPRMDICDDPQSSFVTASLELPGLKPSDISIQLQDEKLTVSGERVLHHQNQSIRFPVQELKYGVFRRVIALPSGVQASQMSASMSDGILVLSWPRDPQRLPPILLQTDD